MNGQDQITVIEARVESVYERRKHMLECDTELLRHVNEVLMGKNARTPSERFADSLGSLRDSMSD